METILPDSSLVSTLRPPRGRCVTARRAASIVALIATLTACSTPAPRGKVDATTGSAPAVLTVPELQRMAEQGTPLGVIMGKIDASGTVYRLDTQQSQDLRAAGMPASLVSYVEQTYDRAVQKNPELAKSDERWTKVDGYWYGGLPYGWPREWVVGAPRIGEAFR
jgi:hypothetical protein